MWAVALLLGSAPAALAQMQIVPVQNTSQDTTQDPAVGPMQSPEAQGPVAQDSVTQDSASQGPAQSSTTQDPAAQDPADDEPDETEAAAAPDANDPDVLKDIDIDKLDWSQLAVDASTLSDAAVKQRAADSASGDTGLNWSSNAQANGASAVAVKRSVSPFWDTRIGADMTVAREPTTISELLAEKAANGGNVPQSSGSAWAAATAPGAGSIWDKTAVEARVDPGQDQSKLGATLTKSVPLNNYSLTLQNGYNVTQQGASHNYQTDQSAKVTFSKTGTSLSAGQSLSSADDKWLHKFGAEQKLLDDVTVSGTVGETATGATNKSLTAGYKKSW